MKNILVVLLLCFAVLGGSSGDDPLKEVVAYAGLPVILPCQQHLPKNTEVPTIEWSKDGLQPSSYVFVYRQNFEVYEEKHPEYEFRTNLFMTQVQHGNFSMRLSDVRKADAGRYFCKTIGKKNKIDIKTVDLVVVDIPTPRISVVSSESGRVELSCEVSSCLQEPRLTFWDGDRNALKAEEPKKTPEDSTGCYRVEMRVTAPTSVKSVVCRAEIAEINLSRETHMLMPVDIPMPKISVVSLQSGTVELSCEVSSCSREPTLMFWDGDRNALEAVKPKRTHEDSTGCYRVEMRVTAPTSVKSVVCRAEVAEINLSRETHMQMPEKNEESCTLPMVIIGSVTGVAIVVIVLVVLLIKKICCKSAEKKKSEKKLDRQPTDESSTSNASENQHLLQQQNDMVPFTAVVIPDGQEQPHTPQTQEPDLISSTSSSIHSKTDGKTGSVLNVFPDAMANGSRGEVDAKPATCEINDASKSVKFKNKLTRQNAAAVVDCLLSQEVLPHSSPNLANGIKVAPSKKRPVTRSRSVSDSYSVPSSFDIHYRRHSISESMRKFQQLQEEEPE